jgi:hypothetical protein
VRFSSPALLQTALSRSIIDLIAALGHCDATIIGCTDFARFLHHADAFDQT